MVSFRKAFLLLAALVTITAVASAQPVATCTAYTSNAPTVRWEGLAEEIGQVVIECRGGTPTTPTGTQLNTINIQVFLDTNVTSKRTTSSSSSALEAVLLVDEPTSTEVTSATICTAANTPCPGYATGTDLFKNGTNKVAYQGVLATNNSVLWAGVPFNAPGTNLTRVMRIANIRANANALALSTLLPTAINMYVTISGTGAPNLQNNQLQVAYLQRGLRFGSSDNAASYLQCEPSDGSTVRKFELRFREWFPTAFKRNAGVGQYQDVLGTSAIYYTESMYYEADVAATFGTEAGRGTQPTRLMATFTGIPANVIVRVPRLWPNTTSTADDEVMLIQCFDGVGNSCSTPVGTGSTYEPPIIGGAVTVVYEVTESVSGTLADLKIPAELRWGPIKDGIAGPPGTGTVTVSGSFAPLSTAVTATQGPVPRFVTADNSTATFSINPCRTNLLFTYVTTQGGFDTGMVIANTSADKFGTVPQSGTCTLDYFGDVDGGAAPASVTTDTIPAGQSLIASVTTGGAGKNGFSLPAAKGFQGYIIAKCNFQFAHGYAYVYSGPSFNGASGYLALVLDGDKDDARSGTLSIDTGSAIGTGTITLKAPGTRTGSISEVRAH